MRQSLLLLKVSLHLSLCRALARSPLELVTGETLRIFLFSGLKVNLEVAWSVSQFGKVWGFSLFAPNFLLAK